MSDKRIRVIDIECTFGPTAHNDPSPYIDKNQLVAIGMLDVDGLTQSMHIEYAPRTYYSRGTPCDPFFFTQLTTIVTHNGAFDFKWLFRHYGLEDVLATLDDRRASIEGACYPSFWDTQIAEYIMSGQRTTMVSLANACAARGIPGKAGADEIKQLWDAGVDTDAIDEALLEHYLQGDLMATHGLYLEQVKECTPELRKLIELHSEAQFWFAVMEHRGCDYSVEKMQEMSSKLSHKAAKCTRNLTESIRLLYPTMPAEILERIENSLTPALLSSLLFGTPGIKWTRREQVGLYKNGNVKYKSVPHLWYPEVLVSPGRYDAKMLKTGWFQVDETMLEKIIEGEGTVPKALCTMILQRRKAEKLVSTYLDPMLEQCELHKSGGKVRGQIMQTVTATGRTSMRKPNLQNTNPLIDKACLVKYPQMLGLDWSQLEIVMAAHCSGDSQLSEDILSKKDIHYLTGKRVMGWKSPEDMTKATRTVVKGVNFRILYGGGASSFDGDKKLIRELIKSFYQRYPSVKEWQDTLVDEASSEYEQDPGLEPIGGEVRHVYTIEEDHGTGRFWKVPSQRAPDFVRKSTGQRQCLSPTQAKNYPIQGLATGDFSVIALVVMSRFLYLRRRYILQRLGICESDMFIRDDNGELYPLEDMEWELYNFVHDGYKLRGRLGGNFTAHKEKLRETLEALCLNYAAGHFGLFNKVWPRLDIE